MPGLSTGIFDPARSQVNVTLRGLYFSSGTQEGTPIDQLLGTIGRSFGSSFTGASFRHRQKLLSA